MGHSFPGFTLAEPGGTLMVTSSAVAESSMVSELCGLVGVGASRVTVLPGEMPPANNTKCANIACGFRT